MAVVRNKFFTAEEELSVGLSETRDVLALLFNPRHVSGTVNDLLKPTIEILRSELQGRPMGEAPNALSQAVHYAQNICKLTRTKSMLELTDQWRLMPVSQRVMWLSGSGMDRISILTIRSLVGQYARLLDSMETAEFV